MVVEWKWVLVTWPLVWAAMAELDVSETGALVLQGGIGQEHVLILLYGFR